MNSMSLGSNRLLGLRVIVYLEFAWIANVPILLLFFALSFIEPTILAESQGTVMDLAIYTTFAGAAISSYIATRNMQTNHIIVGTIVGVISLIMNMIMLLILFPGIIGFYFGFVPFFILGGSIGGFWGRRHRQQSR
jgi:hypothetical protein